MIWLMQKLCDICIKKNKKGLWILNMLNEMCVTIDQIIYWFQQVYHSYSETCQVFELANHCTG